MKKVLLVAFALIISVAFVGAVFAQAPAAKETKPVEQPLVKEAPAVVGGAKKIDTKKIEGAKDEGRPGVSKVEGAVAAGAAKAPVFKGKVVSVDDAAKTIVVKGAKGEKTFDVSMAQNMPKLKAGDQVSFNYIEKEGKAMAGNFFVKGQKMAPKGPSDAISAGAPVPKEAPAK